MPGAVSSVLSRCQRSGISISRLQLFHHPPLMPRTTTSALCGCGSTFARAVPRGVGEDRLPAAIGQFDAPRDEEPGIPVLAQGLDADAVLACREQRPDVVRIQREPLVAAAHLAVVDAQGVLAFGRHAEGRRLDRSRDGAFLGEREARPFWRPATGRWCLCPTRSSRPAPAADRASRRGPARPRTGGGWPA